MKKTKTWVSLAHERLVLIGILLGMVSWIMESLVHSFFFPDHASDFINQLLHPSAHEVWMRLTIAGMFMAFGAYAQRIITARRKAEENTKLAHMELRQIFETAADGMRVVDNNFNVLRANNTFSMLSGLGRDAAAGRKCYEVFSGPICHTPRCPMKRILAGEERVEQDEEKVLRDGRKVPCIVTATPFRGPDGRLIGIVENFKDISDRKEAEKELRQSHERLRELASHLESAREEERSRIAREIHDELGQTLTVLKMDTHWLARRLPEQEEGIVQKVKTMSDRLDSTVHMVQRLSSELRPGLLDDLGLSAAIEWQAKEFRDRLGAEVDIISNPEDIDLDQASSTALFRIFQETMTNIARHATATRVEVVLAEQSDTVELEVRDNGKGITKGQIHDPKSFGLIGMRERVHALGGTFHITGISNIGTFVNIRIPTSRGDMND